MADETERIEYVFEGDVASLAAATKQAISNLAKYSKSVEAASKTDAFKQSNSTISVFKRSLKSLTSDLGVVQKQLQELGSKDFKSAMSLKTSDAGAIASMNAQLKNFNSTNTVTLEQLKTMTAATSALMSVTRNFSDTLRTVSLNQQQVAGSTRVSNTAITNLLDRLRNLKEQSNVFRTIVADLSKMSSSLTVTSQRMNTLQLSSQRAFSETAGLSSTVASAIRRVSSSADSSASSFTRLGTASKNLQSILLALNAVMLQETSGVSREDSALKNKNKTLGSSAKSHTKLSNVVERLRDGFSREIQLIKKLTQLSREASTGTNLFKHALQSLAGVSIADALGKAIKSANDFVENQNLFQVAMGSSVEKGEAFVRQMQEVYGMDPSNLYRYAGYFYQLTDAIGMSEEASASMSLSMTKAANDIASLFNVDIETVVNNLASGMQGMTKAVRKYGMDIRVATLQQTALKYGITESVSSMSEANRQALRYITMLEQAQNALRQTTTDEKGATTATGDFARNIETNANQLRIFKEQISQLGRAIGNFFTGALGKAIAYVNGLIMAIRTLLNFLASLLGLFSKTGSSFEGISNGADDAADAIDGVGSAAGGAAKKMKDLLAPFDELNILQNETSSGGGGGGALDDLVDPALLDAIKNMELSLENIQMKANQVRDAILNFLGFTVSDLGEIIGFDKNLLRDNLIEVFPEWEAVLVDAFKKWDLSSVGIIAGAVLTGALTDLKQFIAWENVGATIQSIVSNFATILNSFFSTINGYVLGGVIGEALNTAVHTAFEIFTQVDFGAIGEIAGQKISGIFYNIDWMLVGQTITAGLIAALDYFNSQVTAINWSFIGSSIATALVNIDWTGVTGSLFDFAANLLTGIYTALTAALPAFSESLVEIVTGIANGFSKFINVITPVGLEYIEALWTGFMQGIPALIDGLGTVIQSILSWLAAKTPVIIESVVSNLPAVIDSIVSFFHDNLPTIVSTGIKLLTSLVAGINDAIVEIVLALPAIIEAIVATLIENIPEIVAAGVTLLGALLNDVGAILVALGGSIAAIIAGICEGLLGLIDKIIDVGRNLVEGIWQGMLEKVDWLKEQISGFATSIVDKVKEVFGVHSPSVVFADIGKNLALGLSEGVENNKGIATNSVALMSSDITAAAEEMQIYFTEFSNQLVTNMQSAFRQMASIVPNIFSNMYSSIITRTNSFASQLQQKLQQMVNAARSAARDISSALASAGTNLAKLNSLADGVSEGNSSVTQTVTHTTTTVVKPKLATGGVVRKPTEALIGEGAYSEAVIPLGDSPEMQELVQRIADAVDKDPNGSAPIDVHVYFGGKEIDAEIYEASERGKKIVGNNPVKTGG